MEKKYEIRYQIIIDLSEKEANYYKSHGWKTVGCMKRNLTTNFDINH